RRDERAGVADVIGELDGEIRAQRIERAVREVDEAAQRKDERQSERDQQVIRADEQAVQDLLEDLDEHRTIVIPAEAGIQRRSYSFVKSTTLGPRSVTN